MSYDTLDTIAAIATASGGAARGIVRISGHNALAIVERCFRPFDGQSLADLRHATAVGGNLRVELNDAPQLVPCDLYLWPTERSYTHEPVAELHTIGSPPIVEVALAAVCKNGARLAEPGEFTLRAFLAGRIDLTQAEAVLGVIDAHDKAELTGALAQLAGGLARPLAHLRDELLQLLAELEAGLDFVEDDIRFISPGKLQERLAAAAAEIEESIAQLTSRHAAQAAEQVVLFGLPNVGKSSLFNAMIAARGAARESAGTTMAGAIVSAERGTTRDYLSTQIDLGGVVCELVDTAGVQADEAEVCDEAAAVGRAAQAMTNSRKKQATIRVLCVEMTAGSEMPASTVASSGATRLADVIVVTKADLETHGTTPQYSLPVAVPVVPTSSVTGQGLDVLCLTLRSMLVGDPDLRPSRTVAATADRCRDSLRRAATSLDRASTLVASGGGDELVAAELRGTLDELGRVVGAVYTDDLLDRIFKTFCIGK